MRFCPEKIAPVNASLIEICQKSLIFDVELKMDDERVPFIGIGLSPVRQRHSTHKMKPADPSNIRPVVCTIKVLRS